jgi:amyloid beta precursor protein binding protein 1
VERFVAANGRFPGAFDDEVEADVAKLKAFVTALTGELGIDSSKVSDDQIHEICRCGGAELHTIASVMGAVAAQEVIKLVTLKWVPLNNSFLYNGMTSVASRYEA